MDEPDSDDYDSDEMNEAFDLAWTGLKNGSLKCLNSDGTFRCPYSPGRKKQNYVYSELHQHAVGVGKGERGPVAAGNHRALQKYLEQDMAARAHPQAERVIHLQQEVPSRVDNDDKRVRPWMGILQNIDNRTRRPADQFRIGPGAADIKEHLRAFNPESVKVLYDYKGHLGMAVVGFRNTMDGFKDAEAFENSFCLKRRGRKDFEMNYPHALGEHLYGWMATEKDVDGWNKGSHKLLVEHLRANGDLKCLPEIVKELELTAQQQVQNLKKVVINKDDVLQVTHRENWSLTNKVDLVTAQREQAESEKLKLIENHKKELEGLQRAASLAAEEHERNMGAYRTQIENRMKELESKCSELGMLQIENEAEKARNFAERQETQKLLAWYKVQAKIQEEQQLKQIELIKKHKDESDKLENELQEQRKKLQAKHWRELENHRVTEQLEAEKAKKAEIIEANIEETEKEKEEYVKKIAELEEKLKDCEEDMDYNNDLVNQLTISHRQANSEVEDAKTLIIKLKVLEKYGTSDIGVKRLGQLNTEGWWEACGHKFPSKMRFCKWQSRVETLMADNTFNPIRVESDGKGGHKYSVNEDDKELTNIREKYGPLVANAVAAAMLELTTWNPSGRYIVSMPWDFKANQKATMSQLFDFFLKVIKNKEDEVKETQKKLKALEEAMALTKEKTKGPASGVSKGKKRPRP
ncbi:protein INVOLVED IN DE NOVO 2 isoform X2 [Physcomitrium patens]|nr:protein INVOLVED IN DE NOVO 2-like isoform X2 [Physcomitrium patens]XP_024392388.1 protein INVOLVED IN DE NOVO 2-like isoform X2 [Physcomitrium patens]XP_024392389.1 protein INVOLVED IN DE NOVO 2-like isoform X2 [Physcomitrium patens]PNR42646.1 hypothetical protein PHYPA_017476 [Physcomitrium patens]|eukprot:XP_024392387.1 protein INVOLVED IN DE NOVO 2-like isoform X2 [Physcomitrella patens]